MYAHIGRSVVFNSNRYAFRTFELPLCFIFLLLVLRQNDNFNYIRLFAFDSTQLLCDVLEFVRTFHQL